MSSQVKTLVIPAAGLGTRLRPMTYVSPKELLRIVDKPAAYYLLAEAHQAGITKVIFITHTDSSATKDFFESNQAEFLLKDFPGLTVTCIETSERGGDGQALLAAEKYMSPDVPFAVSMGDLLALPGTSLLAELVKEYERNSIPVISIEEIPQDKVSQYGIIDPGETNERTTKIQGIVEKPEKDQAPSTLAMTGKYVLLPEIFSFLKNCVPDAKGEIKLAHALHAYAKEHALHAYNCVAKHYDIGTKLNLFKTEVAFTLIHPELGHEAQKILETTQKAAQ